MSAAEAEGPRRGAGAPPSRSASGPRRHRAAARRTERGRTRPRGPARCAAPRAGQPRRAADGDGVDRRAPRARGRAAAHACAGVRAARRRQPDPGRRARARRRAIASIVPRARCAPSPSSRRRRSAGCAGQRARLRLDGFPWTQYGHVDATVTRVASETREQRVRVELTVRRRRPTPRSRSQHGMPGVVEIEVERVAPLALLFARSDSRCRATAAAAPPRSRRPSRRVRDRAADAGRRRFSRRRSCRPRRWTAARPRSRACSKASASPPAIRVCRRPADRRRRDLDRHARADRRRARPRRRADHAAGRSRAALPPARALPALLVVRRDDMTHFLSRGGVTGRSSR